MSEQNENQEDVTAKEVLDQNLDAIAEEERLRKIELVRALPAQKVLTKKEQEILLTIKEEELTEADKFRISWATIRLKHHNYRGTDYTPAQKKRVKAKRRMASKSRKANR
jgi:hypothetical protein